MSLGAVAAFVLVNLLLVAACLFALRQNERLRSEIADDVALLTPAIGTVLPPLAGEDWTGARQSVAYSEDPRPTLVYTFSMECSYCQENWQAMRALQSLGPGQLRIIYVDTIGDLFTKRYLAANGMERSVILVQLSPASAMAYYARAMPQLVLVDHRGRVQWSHVGELAPADVSKVLLLIGRDQDVSPATKP